jgi:hypothetical protein
MILKTLYLKVGDLGLPTEFTYGFLKRSRFICNYIEREVLGKIRFRTENFDRIVISVSSTPKDGVFVNTERVACVDIPFDRQLYESKSGTDLSFYYIAKLKEGIEKCARFIHIPRDQIFQGLEEFVAGGLKNYWIHKQRTFRQFHLRASLECDLTQEAFYLRLRVFSNDHPVVDSIILQTDPDEIAFAYRFKDVIIDGGDLVVTSKMPEPLWRENLSKLISC